MRVLTDFQKEFILEQFFRINGFAGWRGIATALLETGQCIVGGKESIWSNGGIGNFIKTKDVEYAYNCILYQFDLEWFLTSAWYKQIVGDYYSRLEDEKINLDRKFKEIGDIIPL